ncbi:MAG: lysophospholipid acyltransferase family protein [Kiritimatiellae bacterium]|nr:lysophospholipid acyltransferase family protein [Kiritimatiellia bacterium]
MQHRLRHWVEYLALRLIAGVMRRLPHAMGLACAWLLARAAFHLFRFRRAETLRRIGEVFGPACSPRQRRRIAWLSLRNTCFNAVELMRARSYTAQWMRAHVENHDACVETLRQLVVKHGGAIVAVPHLGNWDLAGLAVHLAGIKIFSVAGLQRNRLVNAWINRQRGCGIDIIDRGSSALRQIVRRLRQGETFAILPDVRTRRPDLDIAFLGRTANLGRGMAQFARAAGVPIFPVIVSRRGWCRQRFDGLPPVYPDNALDKETDIRRMTGYVMAGIEAAIRADPGQWFWYNKRWVLEPLTAETATAGETDGESLI